jgi:hypothetical protein
MTRPKRKKLQRESFPTQHGRAEAEEDITLCKHNFYWSKVAQKKRNGQVEGERNLIVCAAEKDDK